MFCGNLYVKALGTESGKSTSVKKVFKSGKNLGVKE